MKINSPICVRVKIHENCLLVDNAQSASITTSLMFPQLCSRVCNTNQHTFHPAQNVNPFVPSSLVLARTKDPSICGIAAQVQRRELSWVKSEDKTMYGNAARACVKSTAWQRLCVNGQHFVFKPAHRLNASNFTIGMDS